MRSDILVIGGGAAGLMAAIGAAKVLAGNGGGGTVAVLEKMPKAGRKVMITGKGRCNFTNVKDWQDFSAHVRTDANFVSAAWHNLTPEDMIAFLKEQGWNTMRVRLFVDPTRDNDKAVIQDLDYVKALGKRIKDAGLYFMLDFHYSDTWADEISSLLQT